MARIVHTLFALILSTSAALAAMPRDPAEQARIFATCAGRYSAVLEHDWLVGGDAGLAETRRDTFELMLETVLPDARDHGFGGADLWRYRVGAKQAQARLLEMASFHGDRLRATRAATMAARQMRLCDTLILG